jgi:acyl-coenzyme A thioesterase PaaI-like protein
VNDPGTDSDHRRSPHQGRAVGAYFRLQRWELPPPGGEGPAAFGGRVAIDDHLRGPGGGLVTGGLLTCVDSLAGMLAGMAVLPQWTVTTSLMLQVHHLAQIGPLRLHGRVLRQGRSSVVAAVDIVDEGAADLQVASSTVTCAVLDPGDRSFRFDRPVLLPAPPVDPHPLPVEQFFGIEPGSGPVTRLELTDTLRNTWGILHGGAVATLAEVAARRAAEVGWSAPTATTDVVLHYLAPGRVGPIEARGEVLGTRRDGTVVRVAMHDLGRDHRLVSVASVTVRGV